MAIPTNDSVTAQSNYARRSHIPILLSADQLADRSALAPSRMNRPGVTVYFRAGGFKRFPDARVWEAHDGWFDLYDDSTVDDKGDFIPVAGLPYDIIMYVAYGAPQME